MTDDIWKRQYDAMLRFWADEGTRFWTRFQVFLAVNSGLLGLFPIILNLLSSESYEISSFSIQVLSLISIMGIIVATTWFLFTYSGKGIQKHWKGQIDELEKLHPNEFSFNMNFDRKMGRWDFHMTDLAILIPLFFIIVWGILIVGFNLHFVFNII